MKKGIAFKLSTRTIEIITTALIAAGLTFFQSVASAQGLSCELPADPATAGAVGGTLSLIKILVQRA